MRSLGASATEGVRLAPQKLIVGTQSAVVACHQFPLIFEALALSIAQDDDRCAFLVATNVLPRDAKPL